MKYRFLTLVVLAALILGLFSGCSDPAPVPEETTVPTEPAPTAPPDGNPDDVTCKGSYTAADADVRTLGHFTVATAGSSQLTLSQLQVYYWLEVAQFRMNGTQPEPDFSQPLDTQSCPLDHSIASWQQYFLREALNTWHTHQALVLMGQEEGIALPEIFTPDKAKHTYYIGEKPAVKYLYGHSESYLPNDMHQAWLDAIPDTLENLARDNGYTNLDAQAAAIAGEATDGQVLIDYTDLFNRAYMYFTERGYHFEPADEEIQAHYEENKAAIDALEHEKTVDIRHILLLPDNAAIAPDGTVSASEEDWTQCLARAEEMVHSWQVSVDRTRFALNCPNSVPEARFSEDAREYSMDSGSALNGGLYKNLRPGQLLPELDAWCFDEARQHGDYAILRSPAGCHIVFFSAAREGWYSAAEAHLIQQMYGELLLSAREKYPMSVTYSVIRLGQAADNGSFVTPADLLYPDVAHERYPAMPLFIQQDYTKARYNNWTVSSHGCGITTLAMVASYFTDEELTPAELAAQYGYYCGIRGTDVTMFDDTPAELGFFLEKRSSDWDEIHEAIESGHVVVSLQHAGYWTRGGHYIAITDVTEDNTYVVRDSNLYNYQRILAHAEDAHTKSSIIASGQYYWIYEPKVTRCSACVRCSEDLSAGAPDILLRSDYLCPKCCDAITRQDAFLTGNVN